MKTVIKQVGIDYSMTGPSVCLITNTDEVYIYTICKTKKYQGEYEHKNFKINIGEYPKAFDHQIERFKWISEYFINILMEYVYDKDCVWNIEGYSMGSKGKVFHIAENTAILKRDLSKSGIYPNEIAPTTVKKSATDKGNSAKEAMETAFVRQTGFALSELIDCKFGGAPANDMVDSYFIARYIL